MPNTNKVTVERYCSCMLPTAYLAATVAYTRKLRNACIMILPELLIEINSTALRMVAHTCSLFLEPHKKHSTLYCDSL
jgi:hypothetical protein